jgi:hypothetical protein
MEEHEPGRLAELGAMDLIMPIGATITIEGDDARSVVR